MTTVLLVRILVRNGRAVRVLSMEETLCPPNDPGSPEIKIHPAMFEPVRQAAEQRGLGLYLEPVEDRER